jgi:ABC-2 type transport system permease protein
LKIILSIALTIFIALGFTIYKEEQKSIELSSKERNNAFNKFETAFEKYAAIENQPKVTDLDLNIQIYPKENKLMITGNSILVNKSNEPIDILLVKTGFDEETKFNLDRNYEIIDQDTYVNFYVLKLEKSLQQNDSLNLSFDLKTKHNTIFENNSNVLNNGTFFKNDILPRIGYFLNSSKKHPNDSSAKKKHYYSIDSDFINLKTIISTSKDQTAIAPGYLMDSWSKNNRNYFEYQTKNKIKNSLSFSSGNYNVFRENYKGVDLEIYHHKSHKYNLKSMSEGLKKALEYNTLHFGDYQFNEARIIEFPITEGTYASVMGNSIPTSELRFIANSSEDKINLSFYTIAHELTHQWWGNQVVPADAFGAVMLSESITEYISLNIFEQQFGSEKAKDFLHQQRDRYIKGRTSETENEPPLYLVKGHQQYLSYAKGTLALNALSHYLGKDKFHEILNEFLKIYKDTEAPYPTSLDFLNLLNDQTPDSLKYVINDWFNTVTFYDNSIQSVNSTLVTDNNFEITINFELKKYQNEEEDNFISFNETIEFGVYDENDKLIKIEKVKVNQISNSHKFIHSEKPKKIVLDPNLLLLEKDIKDNTYKF